MKLERSPKNPLLHAPLLAVFSLLLALVVERRLRRTTAQMIQEAHQFERQEREAALWAFWSRRLGDDDEGQR